MFGHRRSVWLHVVFLGGCSSAALCGCAGGTGEARPAGASETASPPPESTSDAHGESVRASSASNAAANASLSAPPSVSRGADEGGEGGGGASGGAAASSAKKPQADDANATREVLYVATPSGLKVTVAGVKFSVSVGAAQVGAGWGVKLSVVASAEDGNPHSLSSPQSGPLAFGGQVQRKASSKAGAEPERFGDERVGDGEQSIFGDDTTKFARTWPPKGVHPLAAGDALDLQVALWGLGANTESRRPVKKFCHVHMDVGKGKPRPVLEPPSDAAGQ